jgi:hypothetical protein
MTKSVAALAILLFFTSASCDTVEKGPAKEPLQQPSGWMLMLKSGGMPGTTQIHVRLHPSGHLVITENDGRATSGDSVVEFSAKVPPADVQEIYERTWKILKEFRFPEEPDQLNDGTFISLGLHANGRGLSANFHVAQAGCEIPDVARVMALINKHLPKERQVY